jgi:membrane protein DedA with SNARE-associated domain
MFEGETIVVIAGYAAHRGYLSPVGVAAAAFAGSLAGDQVAFLLGRRFSAGVLTRRPSWAQRVSQLRAWFDRHATLLMVGFRFVYGIRALALTGVAVAIVLAIKRRTPGGLS